MTLVLAAGGAGHLRFRNHISGVRHDACVEGGPPRGGFDPRIVLSAGR